MDVTRRRAPLPSFWQLQLVGWTAYFFSMAFSRIGRFPLSYMLAEKSLLAGLGVVISLGLRVVLRRQLARGASMATIVVTCVVASYGLAMVWTALGNIGAERIGTAMLGVRPFITSVSALLGGTVYNSFTLVAWGFLYLGLKYHLALQDERERALRAETLVAEVKLGALRYQLNPHFFFNTLNAVSTLVVERRNDDAALMIARLGDFLRSTLRADVPAMIPFADELSLAAQYLDIEQVRFGERLVIRYDIKEDAYRALVPVLLLQPLIENASRHGIAPLSEGGTIAISAWLAESTLHIVVENSGPVSVSTAPCTRGVGLNNVGERLATLYGSDHAFSAAALAAGGFRVHLELPNRDV